jgi:hypothetical protein
MSFSNDGSAHIFPKPGPSTVQEDRFHLVGLRPSVGYADAEFRSVGSKQVNSPFSIATSHFN